MTRIKHYTEQIDDELCSAKDYAEKYVEYKSESNSTLAQKYKEMANDELKHSMYLHDIAVAEIKKLKDAGLVPTQEMQDKWDRSHTDYVERTAWIKTMLTM